MVAFGMLYMGILLVFTQYNTGLGGQSSGVLFKRGSRATLARGAGTDIRDEEMSHLHHRDLTEEKNCVKDHIEANVNVEKTSTNQPNMADVFSWQHINYTVPLRNHEHRQLLDDVSGYVAPRMLTALMGGSGAGKVRGSTGFLGPTS
jgi:ATP-binding cassette subfamily G (WHITE) protein 2 (SNQ2)